MNRFSNLSMVIRIAVVGLTAMCVGCGASRESARETTAELEAEISVKEDKLAELDEDIAHAECCSTKANIEARVTRLRTDCLIEVAAYDRCAAKKKKGTESLLDCVVGIGAATATKGVAYMAALTPCAALLDAGTAECRVPECAKKLDQVEQQVFAEMGLDGWPQCACKEDVKSEK